MRKLLYALIFVQPILFLSCGDSGYCNVEGNVYEEGTNVPIPNVYVRINKSSVVPFAEATTNNNGHYKIKYYKGLVNPSITMDIISGEHLSLISIPVDSKNANISAYLRPYSPVKLRIVNNSNNNLRVNVFLQTQKNHFPLFESAANSDVTHNNATVNIAMNKYCKLSWQYYLSSNNAYLGSGTDSVIVTNKLNPVLYTIHIN